MISFSGIGDDKRRFLSTGSRVISTRLPLAINLRALDVRLFIIRIRAFNPLQRLSGFGMLSTTTKRSPGENGLVIKSAAPREIPLPIVQTVGCGEKICGGRFECHSDSGGKFIGSYFFISLIPVHIGHETVHQDQIDADRHQLFQSVFSVNGFHELAIDIMQFLLDDVSHGGTVVNNQNFSRH